MYVSYTQFPYFLARFNLNLKAASSSFLSLRQPNWVHPPPIAFFPLLRLHFTYFWQIYKMHLQRSFSLLINKSLLLIIIPIAAFHTSLQCSLYIFYHSLPPRVYLISSQLTLSVLVYLFIYKIMFQISLCVLFCMINFNNDNGQDRVDKDKKRNDLFVVKNCYFSF